MSAEQGNGSPTFNQFVKALEAAGWKAVGDGQWAGVAALWTQWFGSQPSAPPPAAGDENLRSGDAIQNVSLDATQRKQAFLLEPAVSDDPVSAAYELVYLRSTVTDLRRSNAAYENAHAVLTAMAQQRWLPIESAPKDGASILVCGGTFDTNEQAYGDMPLRGIVTTYWYQDQWRGEDCQAHDVWQVLKPLYWQPLPPPPEEVKS